MFVEKFKVADFEQSRFWILWVT